MNYPTHAELKAAYDGITADGERSEVTMTLCTIITLDPLMRQVVRLNTEIADETFAGPTPELMTVPAALREAFIVSCIARGLNLGMRIADARQNGVKSRREIEDLIAHVSKCADTKPECVEEITRMLKWTIGGK